MSILIINSIHSIFSIDSPEEEEEEEDSGSDTSVESQNYNDEEQALHIAEDNNDITSRESLDDEVINREYLHDYHSDDTNRESPVQDDVTKTESSYYDVTMSPHTSQSLQDLHMHESQPQSHLVYDILGYSASDASLYDINPELSEQGIVEVTVNAERQIVDDFDLFMKAKRKRVVETPDREDIFVVEGDTGLPQEDDKFVGVSSGLPDLVRNAAEDDNVSNDRVNNEGSESIDRVLSVKEGAPKGEYDNSDSKSVEIIGSHTISNKGSWRKETWHNVVDTETEVVEMNTDTKESAGKCEKNRLQSDISWYNNLTKSYGLEESETDLPWLYYFGLASGTTFLASYTNLSPFIYTLVWVFISFVSFQLLGKEKHHT